MTEEQIIKDLRKIKRADVKGNTSSLAGKTWGNVTGDPKELFEKMKPYLEAKDENGNFLHKNDDGTYDLRELADIVARMVGDDKVMDGSKDAVNAELYNLAIELNKTFDLEDNGITEGEARRLITFFDIDIDERSRFNYAKLLNTALDSAAGAFAGYRGCTKYTSMILEDLTYRRELFVDIDQLVQFCNTNGVSYTTEELASILGIEGDVHQQFQMADIKNIILKSKGELVKDAAGAALEGALIGFLVSLAEDIFIGRPKEFEEGCVSINGGPIDAYEQDHIDRDKYLGNMQKYDPNSYSKLKGVAADEKYDEYNELQSNAIFGFITQEKYKPTTDTAYKVVLEDMEQKIVKMINDKKPITKKTLDETFTGEREKAILNSFYEVAGTWNYQLYNHDLREAAGPNSNLGCDELTARQGSSKPAPSGKKEYIMADEMVAKVERKPVVTPPTVEYEDQQDCQTFFDGDVYTEVSKIYWPDLIKWWDGQSEGPSLRDKYGLSDAITILKMVQCLDKDHKDYSPEFLEELLRLSKTKNCAGLKTVEGFNYEHYMELRGGKMPPNLNMPMELAGVKRSCDKTAKDLVHTTPITKKGNNGKSKYKAQVGEKWTEGSTTYRTEVTGLEQKYHATEKGSGKDNVFNDPTSRDLWKKSQQKDNPNATFTDHGKDKKKYDEEAKKSK